MANALTPVEFHGATLITIDINGVAHVALRPICEAIGLDWQAQHARILRHPVLSTCVSVTKTQLPGDTQAREVLVLPLDKLNGFLFGVNAARVKPELREKLIQYQRECFDALHSHFAAKAAPRIGHSAPPPALAMASIDPRALMLSGQSEPVPLTREQQALVNRRAWLLAHEAYELAREHIERRVAYKTTHKTRADAADTEIAELVDQVTLGNALAHVYRDQLAAQLCLAEVVGQMAEQNIARLRALNGVPARVEGSGK